MADPRFYDNCGPFSLATICAYASLPVPDSIDLSSSVGDVASLEGAGRGQLTYCVGQTASKSLRSSRAGFCLIPENLDIEGMDNGVSLIRCRSVQHAFAVIAAQFYPQFGLLEPVQHSPIHPDAIVGKEVKLGANAVVGANAEIGEGTSIGPNTVISRGVSIGRNCEIGSNVTITHSYIGDAVSIFPGAKIGAPGFGFASGPSGHIKIPQLGRVIVQDNVEIGANTTIDRGALGDTVIGEGTKIDNLCQIGHNTHIGRHCIIVSQVGISGSCELGDFVVLGGQAGVADHAHIGDGARLAARGAFAPGPYAGGQDWGGVPARPMKQWARELAAVTMLVKRRKRDGNG